MKQIPPELMRRCKFFFFLRAILLLINNLSLFKKYRRDSKRGYIFSSGDSVKNFLNQAYHPVETAMTNADDLVHLLVRLGASVNTIPKAIAESSYYKNKISLKDWIDNEIHKLDTRIIEPVDAAPAMLSTTTSPECSGSWEKFYKEYQVSLNTLTEKELRKQALQKEKEGREKLEELEKAEDSKAYFVEVKKLIEDHGATTLGKLPKDETSSRSSSPSTVEPTHSYKFLSTGYGSRDVPQHLLGLYDQLFEACYVGDDEKIQSLCLPAEDAQPGSTLLNISVKMVDNTDDNYNCKRLPEAP
jgi:hypothetical protein